MNNSNNSLFWYLAIIFILVMIASGSSPLVPIIVMALIYFVHRMKNSKEKVTNPHVYTMNDNNMSFESIRRKFRHMSLGVVGVIATIIFLINAVVVVPAGETGVYHLFGKVRDKEVSSGIHIINPLASIRKMSIRTEEYTMSIATTEGQKFGDDSIEALTKEGLKVGLDITILYHLIEESASDVYKNIGLNYEEKVIRPEVRSAIREVIALYEAKDIYSDKRDEAVQKISDLLNNSLGERGIEIESVLLRNVSLPALLTSAIEEKLSAEQEAQKYDFILQREEKEAERKRIEAGGQRDAQRIINESLTSKYIQYLYIQNLENREGTIYVPYDFPLFKGL